MLVDRLRADQIDEALHWASYLHEHVAFSAMQMSMLPACKQCLSCGDEGGSRDSVSLYDCEVMPITQRLKSNRLNT